MRDRKHPSAAVYEQELAETVGTGTERWLTELRLAVIGIIIGVGIGAADIGLSAGGWVAALAAGVGSVLVLLVLFWRLRPRAATRREGIDDDLHRIGDELARIRAELGQERDPLREILDHLAAAAEALAEYMDRLWEENYLATDSTGALRSLRAYDHELHELTAEIRCRRAKA